jgi:hypothetical protein
MERKSLFVTCHPITAATSHKPSREADLSQAAFEAARQALQSQRVDLSDSIELHNDCSLWRRANGTIVCIKMPSECLPLGDYITLEDLADDAYGNDTPEKLQTLTERINQCMDAGSLL